MKKEHIKTEQIKRTKTVKAWKNLSTGSRVEDEKGTKYVVTNKGGTVRRLRSKMLGNRQRRKLGLLPKQTKGAI